MCFVNVYLFVCVCVCFLSFGAGFDCFSSCYSQINCFPRVIAKLVSTVLRATAIFLHFFQNYSRLTDINGKNRLLKTPLKIPIQTVIIDI